jgi:hypothetical protein
VKAPGSNLQISEPFQAARPNGIRWTRFAGWSCALLGLLLSGWGSLSANAQTSINNLVFAVGTTARDASSNDWSYVMIGSPTPAVLDGKIFAVFGKPGYPTNAGTFTARGTMARATDPGTVTSRLNQSIALGQNLTTLSNALNGLLRNTPGITGQSLAQKVLTAFQVAAANPATAQTLGVLATGNPGLQLCAGHAFSELSPATTTYELREINPLTGSPGDVVGRVTIVPNAPVILPAPGPVFQVMTNDPGDHLLIKLRWGTPPELRRLSLMSFGYNLWRIPRAVAEAGNFNNVPPTVTQLHSNTNFTRANVSSAVMARREMALGTGTGAAEDPNDRTTYFFADDGRSTTGTNFLDGQEFYYFVTARDLLGRDGLSSGGRLTRACRRNPPSPPNDVRVENTVLTGSTNQSRLVVIWEQNTNTVDAVNQYWIYRWANATFALTNEATPLSNRVGVVAQVPGTNLNSFVDNSAGALTNANPSNVWYTVRSVSLAACDPLLSSQSGPAWGVLRERSAPAATTGEVLGSCGAPIVKLTTVSTNSTTSVDGLPIRIVVVRRDPGIAWAELSVGSSGILAAFANRIYFPPDGDRIEVPYAVPFEAAVYLYIGCKVGNAYGSISSTVEFVRTDFWPAGSELQVQFLAGQVLSTALSASDPLVTSSNCVSATAAIADTSGMVAVQFPLPPLTTAFIQAQTNGVNWSDVALLTSDSNGVFWVSYPACLIGPVPPFRACLVNVPGTDCDQHVVWADPSGASAPIRVRFRLQPRTREYRVYRRVDNGPLTLIAQGAATYNGLQTNKLIETLDEAMPSVAARICYFVQLLDEHGNGSPLSFIGCKQVKPPQLPVPTLSEPVAAGDTNQPQVSLTWFCPTSGVYRFQFKLQVADSEGGTQPSGLFSTRLSRDVSFVSFSSYAGLTPRTRVNSVVQGLAGTALVKFDEAHLTSPIGPSFGPGPQFTLTANVRANTSYLITVAAVDEQGVVGPSSPVWEFTWRPPALLQNVPWPARPLPHLDEIYFPATLIQHTNLYPKYPVGIIIGSKAVNFDNYQYGLANPDFIPVQPPASVLSKTIYGLAPLPCVLYRMQVTNALFPRVSGDISQVSPLIETIAWHNPCFLGEGPCHESRIRDPLIRALYFEAFGGGDVLVWGFQLCLLDSQPVISGARYKYFLVHFNSQREPDTIFPCGEVTIP